ncbi:MAG: hypothetical protein A3H96_15235 [Acidobacteria bacterium RIFCSPLOWO2_02_FULL_67_36]|nr:MAG: hypothetical protein A3H96_15235 [Acidobacteria bacterium RIFCSPLOWO2_02_FULL_67_36]OFW19332.1 MAG: hypothetical protein A3G21_02440 [Acidobacteria bacterium RIFCSPLOWO2_12_FULL_66_21]
MRLRPGLLLAAVFLCLYGTLAVTVDDSRARYGLQSDEATYYMMGLSLVHDGDLTYRKEDLARVWKEFPAGPAGVFLKKGRQIGGGPDPDETRYFWGKSFVYPLFAAPFILLFGTSGFLVLNAVMLALVLLCGYLFLHARSGAGPSAVLAAAVVMASVVPMYFVQIMPEVFNLSLSCLAYFCWLYKEVAQPDRSPRGTRWLFTPRADLAAALLLAVATFSKPTHALLFVPVLLWQARRRRWSALVKSGAVFAIVAGGFFAVNMAMSGDWNYQGGGDRKSYVFEFPFQNEVTRPQVGAPKSREGVMPEVIFSRRTFTSNLAHNLEYFFVGRYAGMLGYFFPGVFAMLAMLAAPRRRPGWQWLVLGSALVQGLTFLLATPYTWSGGGVGNRYFLSGYGVMLFLLPPIESTALAFVPWVVGALFVAPMVMNPFTAAFRPAGNADGGLLRLLPVELTLLNDLPIFTEADRGRVWFGDLGRGDPGFLLSFLDSNAFREADKSFWVRGESRAEIVIKTDRPIRRATFTLTAGAVATDVTVAIAGRRQSLHLDAGQTTQVTIAMPPGFPYEKEIRGGLLWKASVSSSRGFTPIFFDPDSTDVRYLGVRVTPMLEASPQ